MLLIMYFVFFVPVDGPLIEGSRGYVDPQRFQQQNDLYMQRSGRFSLCILLNTSLFSEFCDIVDSHAINHFINGSRDFLKKKSTHDLYQWHIMFIWDLDAKKRIGNLFFFKK